MLKFFSMVTSAYTFVICSIKINQSINQLSQICMLLLTDDNEFVYHDRHQYMVMRYDASTSTEKVLVNSSIFVSIDRSSHTR